jgi:repressor LexA
MATIAENIKRVRTRTANMTQAEFGKLAGVSSMAVSQWENGRAVPRMGAVERIAAALHISKSEIVDEFKAPNLASAMNMCAVPLRGRVHAGKPVEPDTFDEETALIPSFLLKEDPDTYALISEGDCMNRVYPEGCLIAVSPNRQPQNGSVAVVTIDGEETVMRRMYKTPNTLVLSPDSFNPANVDIVITKEDERTVEFGGKVVWFQAREELE